jgi:hypothetical protein
MLPIQNASLFQTNMDMGMQSLTRARIISSPPFPFGEGAGNTVYDPLSHRILVGVHRKNEIVSIDPVILKITGCYPEFTRHCA